MAEVTWDNLKSKPVGRFETTPHYDPDSDSLTVFIDDTPSFRERIDRRLTVYRSMETKQVIGCQIKQVKAVMATINAFHLGIEADGVTIGLLLLSLPQVGAGTWSIQIDRYREVVRPITERVGGARIPDLVAR